MTVFPSKRHQSVGKGSGKTSYIERFNCTLRQRVSRLVRKTLSFSKKLENHIGAIWYLCTTTMHPYLFRTTPQPFFTLATSEQNYHHLNIQISQVELWPIGFNKFPPGSNAIAHQDCKDPVSFCGVLNCNLLESAGLGVHSGIPQLRWHHFPSPFKSLNIIVGIGREFVLNQVSQLPIAIAVVVRSSPVRFCTGGGQAM